MSDKKEQEFLGKKILQNCRNELYLDFPIWTGHLPVWSMRLTAVSRQFGQMGRRSISIRFFF